MRIVSFLPSATEIACALGLADSIIGITHECDYPPEIKNKQVVVRNVLPIEKMSQSEIDRAVADRMREGKSRNGLHRKLPATPRLLLRQRLPPLSLLSHKCNRLFVLCVFLAILSPKL